MSKLYTFLLDLHGIKLILGVLIINSSINVLIGSFDSLAVSKLIADQSIEEYNQHRSHCSLGYQIPDDFSITCNRGLYLVYALDQSPIAKKDRITHATYTLAEFFSVFNPWSQVIRKVLKKLQYIFHSCVGTLFTVINLIPVNKQFSSQALITN